MVFPVVMYRCESRAIKRGERQRTDSFKLCWRRLLRIPLTARRSNQSILKEINPEYSLEGLMLKLKHQYFGHLIQRVDSLEKTLMLGGIGGRRRRGGQRMRWLDGITTPPHPQGSSPGLLHCRQILYQMSYQGSPPNRGSVQFSHVRLFDPMNCSMPGLPVHHQLLELTQIHVY